MLKIFSLTGFYRVPVLFVFFHFAPLAVCITLHLHVHFVTAGTIVQKRMIVTSFLEDAARKWFCFAFYSLLPLG